ncbi:MAG: tetratricopeptide repeat protein [Saprospiraceae bacterium]|nr:tetratricopeptide repeat protein [Saprospiraceae bacterium]MCB0627162.1 tetratricopeptide repeat protein [Saprospiraceae bacterium]MCB0683435.1 tetratricopeptide repeat protein [Saprospiraceae bacterium]
MKPITLLFAIAIGLTPVLAGAQRLHNGPSPVGRPAIPQDAGYDNQWFLRQADIYLNQFDLEETLFALDNAVAQDPYWADAYIRRALFKYRIGMKTEAEADLQAAQRLNPYAADLYGYNGPNRQLGVLAFLDTKEGTELPLDARLEYYFEILERQGASREVLEAEHLYAAVAAIEQDELNLARFELQQVLALNPQSALAYDLQGLIQTLQGDLASAQGSFLRSIELQPGLAPAWYHLGRIHRALGEPARAEECLDRAIELDPTLHKAYFDRALVRQTRGDAQGAVNDYSLALENGGAAFLSAYRHRGITRKLMGDYSGALQDLDLALEVQGKRADLLNARGIIYLLSGAYAQAIDDLTAALRLDETLAEVYYNRGIAYLLMYDPVSACDDLRISAELGYERANQKLRYFCRP